jgi:hypothetical protein
MRQGLTKFRRAELRVVERSREAAVDLVGDFYALAPREWDRLHYEVRTLRQLAPEEICDRAFAQVLCYAYVKRVDGNVVARHDLYRICLQDHRILRVAEHGESLGKLDLEAMLLYLLTHEMVHVVRFSQRMQQLDLGAEDRPLEELSVELTTRQILAPVAGAALERVIVACAGHGIERGRKREEPATPPALTGK